MKKTSLVVAFSLAAWIPFSPAAIIEQTTYNSTNTQLWNNSVVWGGNTVTSGNSYSTVAGLTTTQHSYAVNGTSWDWQGAVRDTNGDAPASTTFLGDSLILNTQTRLLMKGLDGTVSTASIVMNGGHVILAANSGGLTTLAGALDVAAPLAAIGVYGANGGQSTLNVASTITGSGTLQLTSYGTTRSGTLNVTGDYSAFSGTFYLAIASDEVPALGIFSFAAGVAPLATLNLDTSGSTFLFSLDSSLTFGSAIVGGVTLEPGTYDYAALDAIAPGKFLDSGGTITVVPEPSTTFLMAVGVFALGVMLLRRRNTVCG